MSRNIDEEEIRRRAYAIWEAEGRPQGRELAHWAAAQLELEGPAGQNGAGGQGGHGQPEPASHA